MSVVKNLFYQEGDFKIQIDEWEIADSGITALKGPSGSGKSTIVRLLTGLIKSEILLWEHKGQNLMAMSARERRLGVVFQSYELFPHLSAKENIEFALEAQGLKRDHEAIARTKFLMSRLGMESFLNRKAAVLSGGEQQRTALARALVIHPRFLLLDEPFSALDEDLKAEARSLVKSVLSELKTPALLISHDQRDIDVLAAKTYRLENGRLKT